MYGQVQILFADWCESWIRQQENTYPLEKGKKKNQKTEEAIQEIVVLKELAVSREDGSICGRECCHK